jgi:regulator of sigma E protease
MTLLLTILAFGLMIFVHELGHFLMAKAFGVGIEQFSIGFGKPITQFTSHNVLWRIGWIPLGGYVKMKGENPDEQETTEKDAFSRKPWWQKAIIGFSGPCANIILTLILFIFSFMMPIYIEDQLPVVYKAEGKWAQVFAPGDSIIRGYSEFLQELLSNPQNTVLLSRRGTKQTVIISSSEVDSLAKSLYPYADTRIGEVVPKTPAYHSKLEPGDRIVAIDSLPVSNWYEMREIIVNSNKDEVLLTIERNGQRFNKVLPLESSINTGGNKAIGIIQYQPVKYERRYKPLEAIQLGAVNTVNFIILNYQALGKLVQKPQELTKSVGGPVMIVSMSQSFGKKGFSSLLFFFGSISLMLAIMNLLPIPVLDGGLILFAIIEGIIRKPVPQKIQSILQTIGFFILIFLMVLAFYSDIASEVLRFMNR